MQQFLGTRRNSTENGLSVKESKRKGEIKVSGHNVVEEAELVAGVMYVADIDNRDILV